MTIFALARLPRTAAIALYLHVHGLDGDGGPGRAAPDLGRMSREQIAARTWETTTHTGAPQT